MVMHDCWACHNLQVQVNDLEAKVAELEQDKARLRAAASRHIDALSAWQYAQIPVPALPELAPTANALARLLEQGGEQ